MILDCLSVQRTPNCGVGLYASQFISCGTIVMMECARCSRVSREEAQRSDRWRFIESHAPITICSYPDFLDPCDHRIYFGNHSCRSNALETGLGFDVAVCDIPAGSELTVDYRRFLDPTIDFACGCRHGNCDRHIRCLEERPDLEEFWGQRLQSALKNMRLVAQPLLDCEHARGLLAKLESMSL